MPKHKFDYDLVVIGSGAGGSTAAIQAARAGLSVALVESASFGGDAPNFSDVPMSALIETSHLYDQARKGSRFGISSSALRYNFPTINNWKNIAIKRTGSGNNRRFYDNAGIKTFAGTAHMMDPHEVSVSRKRLSAQNFLIATGSRYIHPDIKNLENIKYLTPRSVTSGTRPPHSLLVVGGGSTGCEIAELYAELGTKVYIAELASRLLPREDEEVGQLFSKVFNDSYGIKVMTESKVVAVQKEGLAKRVFYVRGGNEKSLRVDEILIATGKSPAVDIGLENAGIKYKSGGIAVNEFLQTSMKHIYAAGDVLGGESSTTKAIIDSNTVARNILHRNKTAVNYSGLPRITRTFPEIASVGTLEDDALRYDLKIRKSLIPLGQVSRSNTADFRNGFIKLITNMSGTVIGATVVAPSASLMIPELSLAIKYQMSYKDLAGLPHSFLTWNEAIRLAAAKIK